MTNNTLFFIHAASILIFLYTCLRLGKEALMAFVAGTWIAANFYATKEILLFGFEVTASDVYTIGAMMGLFLIQEYWGKLAVRATLHLSFLLLFFAALTSYFHVQYTPSTHDTMHTTFERLLAPTPRLAIASFVSFVIVQYLEIALFQLFQKAQRIPLSIRAFSVGAITQCLDTLLFSILGLSGIVHSLVDIFVVSYFIKLIVLAVASPTLSLSHHFLPKDYDKQQLPLSI
ncbi:MAG TPA: queuosine precursor transporter [Chlamydiales bacterium]|nr:queuosine precursor transporter [Chlamydiales bacterium]